jgi:hypothetical protein
MPHATTTTTTTTTTHYFAGIAFEQIKPDYLLWGFFRWSFSSASTPAGCLFFLIHGLDEGARDAKFPLKKRVQAPKS